MQTRLIHPAQANVARAALQLTCRSHLVSIPRLLTPAAVAQSHLNTSPIPSRSIFLPAGEQFFCLGVLCCGLSAVSRESDTRYFLNHLSLWCMRVPVLGSMSFKNSQVKAGRGILFWSTRFSCAVAVSTLGPGITSFLCLSFCSVAASCVTCVSFFCPSLFIWAVDAV